MTHTNLRSDIEPGAAPTLAARTFNQLQNDLLSRARIWAVDEVGATMAHQINDPLTALLLYLHEIQERGEHATGAEAIPTSVRKMVDLALRETQRVCDIMERLGHGVEAPLAAETAVARGRETIDSWTRNDARDSLHPSPPPPQSIQRQLTPREREALALITGGSSNKEGGRRMGISTRTFEVHRAHIMEKLGARNAADLVRIALSESR